MGNRTEKNIVVMESSKRKVYHKRTHEDDNMTKCGLFITGFDTKYVNPPKGYRLCGNCARTKS